MSTRHRFGPVSREWMVFALLLMITQGGRAMASTHHRRSRPAGQTTSHAAQREQASHELSAHAAKQSARRAQASPTGRRRWHPGVDLALRMSGQRVPHR